MKHLTHLLCLCVDNMYVFKYHFMVVCDEDGVYLCQNGVCVFVSERCVCVWTVCICVRTVCVCGLCVWEDGVFVSVCCVCVTNVDGRNENSTWISWESYGSRL